MIVNISYLRAPRERKLCQLLDPEIVGLSRLCSLEVHKFYMPRKKMDFLIEMYECRDSIFRGQGGNHLCNTDFDAFSLFFLLFSDGSNCAAGDLTRLFTCVTDFGCEKATSASLTAKLEQKRVKKKKVGKRRKYFLQSHPGLEQGFASTSATSAMIAQDW